MFNYCPRCGHDLRQFNQDDVNTHTYPQALHGSGEPRPASVVQANGSFVNGGSEVEASVAKQRLEATQEQKRDIRNLFNAGKSVYQIKNQLGLDLEPDEIRLIGLGRK